MRRHAIVSLFVASQALSWVAQLPPPSQAQAIQQGAEEIAAQKAAELRDLSKGVLLGTLSGESALPFLRWDAAVVIWKKEAGAGAAPLLAEGVLFDCLGRMTGVRTMILRSEKAVPFFFDLARRRPDRAASAFEAALMLDPGLVEARFRRARIRAPSEAKATDELKRLADGGGGSLFAYLAAITLAEVARAQSNLEDATLWYERARRLYPASIAAAIGTASVKPGASISLGALDATDPYYRYPCRILTGRVDEALGARVRAISPK